MGGFQEYERFQNVYEIQLTGSAIFFGSISYRWRMNVIEIHTLTVMSMKAVHGRSELDLPFTSQRPKDPGEPTAENQQPRGLSAERNKNYSSSVQISSDDVNRGSIGQG